MQTDLEKMAKDLSEEMQYTTTEGSVYDACLKSLTEAYENGKHDYLESRT
jgi:hypothetical protein